MNDDIFLLNLCNEPDCLTANPFLNEVITSNEQSIKNDFPKETASLIIDFWKSMSSLAGRAYENENDHIITTAFWNAFRDYYNNTFNAEVNGIIYPSTMTKNHGLNVVLTPVAVNKYLKLKEVSMIKIKRHDDNSKALDFDSCSNVADVVNSKF